MKNTKPLCAFWNHAPIYTNAHSRVWKHIIPEVPVYSLAVVYATCMHATCMHNHTSMTCQCPHMHWIEVVHLHRRCRKQESSCTNLAATHRVPDPARAPRDAHVRMLEQQLAEARATILHLERDGASVRGAALRLAQEHRQVLQPLALSTLSVRLRMDLSLL